MYFQVHYVLHTVLASCAFQTTIASFTTNKNIPTTKYQNSHTLIFEDFYKNIFGKDNPILKVNRNQNNELIKKALEEITIKRKKTYFTLPDNNEINIPFNGKHEYVTKKIIMLQNMYKAEKDNHDMENENNDKKPDNKETDLTNDFKDSNIKSNVINKRDIFNQNAGFFQNSYNNYLLQPNLKHYNDMPNTYYAEPYFSNNYMKYKDSFPPSDTTDDRNGITFKNTDNGFLSQNSFEETEIFKSYFENPKFVKVMRKQTALMGKLLQLLEREGNSNEVKMGEFESLLESMERNRNKSRDVGVPSRITDKYTTRKMSTVMTLIDETAVRRALKNDPFIRRILKISGKRRADYFQRLKLAKKKEVLRRLKKIYEIQK